MISNLINSDENVKANLIYHDYVAEKYEKDPRVRLGTMHPNCGKRLEWLKDKYFKNNNEIIALNLGVGTGNLMKKANKVFKIVYAMDISKNMLLMANRFTNKLIQGNAIEIPLKNQSLDVVFCVAVLHHIYDLEKFFISVRKVLKNRGVFYSDYDPNRKFHLNIRNSKILFFLLTLYRRISNLFIFDKDEKIKEIHDIAEFHEEYNLGLDPEELVNIAKKSGFSDAYVIYHSDAKNLDYPKKGRIIHKISELLLYPFTNNYSERTKIFSLIAIK